MMVRGERQWGHGYLSAEGGHIDCNTLLNSFTYLNSQRNIDHIAVNASMGQKVCV